MVSGMWSEFYLGNLGTLFLSLMGEGERVSVQQVRRWMSFQISVT